MVDSDQMQYLIWVYTVCSAVFLPILKAYCCNFDFYLQLFELGQDGGENEGDGEVIAESEEVAFECGGRYVFFSLK